MSGRQKPVSAGEHFRSSSVTRRSDRDGRAAGYQRRRFLVALVAVVLVALSIAAWIQAGGDKAEPAPWSSYTLKVPSSELDPDLRVHLAASSLESAEAVQTELNRLPVALRSMLRSSFRTLEIELRDPSLGARVETALRGRSSVLRVERCPCVEKPEAAAAVQVSEFVHWQQRSCSTSRRPVAVEACITRFVTSPHKGPTVGDIYVYAIEARVRSSDRDIARLVGHLTTTESSQMVETSPTNGDYVLKAGHAELPIRVFEYPTGRWSYEDSAAQFSQGQLEIGGFPDVFDISLVPTGREGQIKGATALVVKTSEKPELTYSVLVEAKGL